jgi:hypothetical protein
MLRQHSGNEKRRIIMADENNFIDFILAAKKDSDLAMNFMRLRNAEDVKTFFDKHNYAIKEADIEKIIQVRRIFAELPAPDGSDKY